MSENTVRKYICRQEERGLIAAESTEVITKSSGRQRQPAVHTPPDPKGNRPVLRTATVCVGAGSSSTAGAAASGEVWRGVRSPHERSERMTAPLSALCAPTGLVGVPAPPGPSPQIWAAVGPDESARRGRKKKQDKGRESQAPLQQVTPSRKAGRCKGLRAFRRGGHRWSVWINSGVTGGRNGGKNPVNPLKLRGSEVHLRGHLGDISPFSSRFG